MYTNAQLLGTMLAYAWVLSPKCTRVDSLMHHQGKNLRLSPTPLLPCPSGRTHMQRQMIVLQKVMKLPDLVDHLRCLADKGMALGPLLALLLPPLGTSIFDKKLYAKTALSMVKTLPLGQSYLPVLDSIVHKRCRLCMIKCKHQLSTAAAHFQLDLYA